MGKSIPMQSLITVKGASYSTTPVIQTAKGWLNAEDYKEACIDMLILENTATTAVCCAILEIETAISAEGPWKTLATYGNGYCKTELYLTSNEGGTDRFERFLRWKLDRGTESPEAWKICFRICAVVK